MHGSGGAFIPLALWAISAGGPLGNIERINLEVAADRAVKCGLGPISIRHVPEMQEDILVIATTGSATDDQLTCLDKATNWYWVELPPPIQSRFDAIREARASKLVADDARKWL